MNSVTISGRLTADPEPRYTSDDNSLAVAKYILAVKRGWRPTGRQKSSTEGERPTDFIPVTAFGKGAEYAMKYMKKGTLVGVSGEVHMSKYKNKQGEFVRAFEVAANEQEIYTWPQKTEGETAAPSAGFVDVPEGASEDGMPFN